MNRLARRSLAASPLLFVAVACGGQIPAASPDRPSGQSALMDKTFAGANKCDAKNHTRPFIIEWDATDMSSFEAKAAGDVVFVKYEGCDLQVLDGCNAEVKGALGAYNAVEWTSGSVEKIDISNEGELYARLPLGAASLGGRVSAGEQFHMEYYVSGTRKATRDAVYRAELDKIPACKGATHFVHSYNLGAFALGSAKQIKGEAGGTVWGIGAGGSSKSLSNAEKKGGVLTSCSGDSAREVATCKVPIRLTLRSITDGDNPDVTAATAPETAPATNLAGKVDNKIKADDALKAHLTAATDKMGAGDGKGCIAELDAADRMNRTAAQLSTASGSPFSFTRGQCLMLAGQCDPGKVLVRKYFQATQGTQMGPEMIDTSVDSIAGRMCRGGKMSPRDQLISASNTLSSGMHMRKLPPAECAKAWDTVKKLSASVQPKDDDDHMVKMAVDARQQASSAAACFAHSGACQEGYAAFVEAQKALYTRNGGQMPAFMTDDKMKDSFGRSYPACKGKL